MDKTEKIMDRPNLVYILAASHSGSTLTAMLLNSHPSLCSVGELKATNIGDTSTYRCSCQEFINSCEFWSDIKRAMNAREAQFEVGAADTSLKVIDSPYVGRLLAPLHRSALQEFVRDGLLSLSPAWRRGLAHWQKQNLALVQSIIEVSGSSYVIDSSKIGIRLKYLAGSELFNIKVVRVVRDGRAVALTYMNPDSFADARQPEKRGGGARASTHETLSMYEAAREWKRSNEEAEELKRLFPARDFMTIRYEELCKDPAKVLSGIHGFLDVPVDHAYEHFKSVPHHVIGNGMRLDGSSEIILDERWREVLSDSDLDIFAAVAGSLNRSYGYE